MILRLEIKLSFLKLLFKYLRDKQKMRKIFIKFKSVLFSFQTFHLILQWV
jgi:hypothetical protein